MQLRPEWTQAIPEGWDTRLRQISPIVDRMSHLRFRYRAQYAVWELYDCLPKALLSPDREAQLRTHWSDLPVDQQHGRKQMVTDYQHYMYHTHGVEARRFWVLQGELGGTPATYTHREQRLLEAVGAPDDPPPLGSLEPCPFDERAVKAIQGRDRLLTAGGDLDTMQKAHTGDNLKRDDDDAEREHRKAFLGWWFEQMLPMSDFMKTYLRTTEASQTLRKATRQEADAVTKWKDIFLDTGVLIGAGHADSYTVQVPVTSNILTLS